MSMAGVDWLRLEFECQWIELGVLVRIEETLGAERAFEGRQAVLEQGECDVGLVLFVVQEYVQIGVVVFEPDLKFGQT